jgi:hypothetical protein
VVGFAIRVDKGNNAKQAFNKKLMEGLQFIQQYVDKNACFLPHEKGKKLEPICSKNDMPKYQVVMKGYFCIPNNNSFSKAQQENGKVVKGSGLMGFELDPQQCLEEAGGDLRLMGCSFFFEPYLPWSAKFHFRRDSKRNPGRGVAGTGDGTNQK